MKGVILAGGLGSRLLPITKVTNKHLIPVYDQPMIYYPIQTLWKQGSMKSWLSREENMRATSQTLGNGKHLGVKQFEYTYQEGEGGIADALRLAEDFSDSESLCVMLGDNILEGSIAKAQQDFQDKNWSESDSQRGDGS